MNMDKNDSFDGPLQEGRHTTLRSFSWGNREFTISSDKISLYVGGIPYDTKPMLDILRGSGVDPGKLSPARWISLLRGQPTRLPGCEKPFHAVQSPIRIYSQVPGNNQGQEQGFPDGNVV